MRFLHLSDLHLGKRVCEFSMLDDQRYILEQILSLLDSHPVDAVLLAVSHKAYAALTPEDIKARCKDGNKAVLMDVKGFFDPQAMRAAGIDYWRL